jgi:hypothetical protein
MLSPGGSNVNRNKLCVALLALTALIVTPVTAIVNFNHKVNIAEGNPIPSPIPPVMVAEGNPIPSPIPPVMVAEGNPIPSPLPPVMVAEGNPIPSPIPPVTAFIV